MDDCRLSGGGGMEDCRIVEGGYGKGPGGETGVLEEECGSRFSVSDGVGGETVGVSGCLVPMDKYWVRLLHGIVQRVLVLRVRLIAVDVRRPTL